VPRGTLPLEGCWCGLLAYSPAIGAWSWHGAIRVQYASMGWELSSLGYPISDEFAIPGGRRSNFAHGFITYRYSDGAITVG